MAEKTFEVEIITPLGIFFSGSVSRLRLPGVMGQLGILANHAPLLAMLEPGITSYVQGDKITQIVTGTGFAQINNNHATVLVEVAETPGKVTQTANDIGDLSPDTREAKLLTKAREKLAQTLSEQP
ncbi:MAG: ATP synthase F1 subunit epsilon [bacterium]|nr:ATP synthase F1 subunit epsilon [bacterium]